MPGGAGGAYRPAAVPPAGGAISRFSAPEWDPFLGTPPPYPAGDVQRRGRSGRVGWRVPRSSKDGTDGRGEGGG
jgi:hypothetical protein